MKTFTFLTLGLLLTLSSGCEGPAIDAPVGTVAAEPEEKADDGSIDMSGVKNEPPPVTAEAREFESKDGKKGKKSRKAGGYLGALGSARFTAENDMIKNMYTHALNLYWAEKGHYPKTHEEFMEKIIAFNKINLPELEPGVEYLYDPEDHTLKVHRPEK